MARKYFSNTAVATTLSTSISDADTSLTVNSSTGYPAVPFTIAINPGTSSEEIIKVAAKSGTTFSSLSRGYDNTTARAHTSGASIKHVAAAEDFDALYTHSHATSDGHTNIPIANVTGTVPTTKGGTGLSSLGSAKQVLKVNDAGNALEYGNAEAILNIDGMTDGSGITIADTDDFAISDGGTEKKVNASQIKAYTQHTDEEIEDVVGGMLDGDENFITVEYDDTDGNIDFTVATKDEDNMSSNSATHLPTQQSVKAYVDTHAALNTHLTLVDEDNMSSNSATSVPSQQSVKAYVDGQTHLTLIDEDNFSSDSATQPPSQQSVKAYVDTHAALGTHLTLIDEDNFSTNSATRPPSQQSVKAYVDTHGALGTHLTLIDEDDMATNSATRPPSQQSVKAYVDGQTLSLIDEDDMSSDSATRPPSQQSVKAYVDGASVSSEQVEDIVGAMFSSNTETGITATYVDNGSSSGKINLEVSASSTAILDGDSDFTIEDGVTNGIHYELDNTDMANWNAGGVALTTAGGIFRHHQTQAATYTVATDEGAVMAGPITITGTVTNNGTMVVL
tara:strand:+ start:3133 stop:4821 length:1689 start_codon:yes stop_codon:yes gene_type:complete